ncbi:hypothetical protein M1403_01510 [Patescibacteria group bacterium]|nr:hypothetical protein [Patescibacteria group bacterium]
MKVHSALRHGVDFLLLALIVGLGLAGLIYYRFDLAAQIADVILLSVLYVLWGVLHHFHEGNLALKVIGEYTAIAALVAFVLIIFLLRA